ncbi:Neu5Ac permease [Anaerococcus prevotii]|uniref:TRAP dicarboxylate transporter, DctM subunit n=1 Tax=Anaerococcus prevotii (strain ATCC 9321 / DSM 20548 / JCM 6508 / NCTC 11806 / PC1) TaxID=525919 RepID=C7REL9_ANAPD|nr:TRAP transporter large permease subunit [Anaerococcus prevotii]ACV29632.1 TRAP dicarboxylate transporter, DctM subunit [Anaerococcus prevotii DSM 20548]SUU95305.1 Neu5Ac permease [Anaerococcus prevotii]
MTLLVFIISLLGSMAIGLPIAFALIFSGVSMLAYLNGFDVQIISQNMFNGADSYSMMALPFFMLAGDLMNRGGLTNRLVNAASAWVGHFRGGLGYVTIIATLLFASMVGSAVASTAALGGILIPMMVKANYDREDATGLVAASNLLSPIMPPSAPMIVLGVTASIPVSHLFLAGVAPAIYISAGLAIMWFIVAKKRNIAPLPKEPFEERMKATRDAIWAILMPVGILVGLQTGVFTPTEAGVVAVVYSLIIGLVVYRELNFRDLLDGLISSAKSSAAIMFLVAASAISSWVMTVANIPVLVSNLLHPFVGSPRILMLIILGLILIIGTAMDVNPTILILAPVVLPVIKEAGINEVYFGVVFVISIVMGLLTPPVGTVLNVASAAGGITMEKVVKSVLPFLIVEVIIILLMIIFPQIVIVPFELLSGVQV